MAENKPTPEKEFKHLIRIVNTDIDGNKAILQALRKIKGISFMFSNAVCNLSGIDHSKKAGNLSDAEVKKISEIMEKKKSKEKENSKNKKEKKSKDKKNWKNKEQKSKETRYGADQPRQ